MNRPNIILIVCDQMRGDCLGRAGGGFVQAPNLDHLCARGAWFSHAYSAVPSCLPARAILWTGQDQWHAGLLGMGAGQGPIPSDYPHTLAGELTAGGYRTHLVGKGHFSPQRALMGFQSTELDESGRMPDSDYRRWFRARAPEGVTPDDHGVDWNSWHARPWHCDERLHPSCWTMTRALEFLAGRDPSRPFFLNVSFARPHSPYVPPAWYFDLYHRAQTPPPWLGDWAAARVDDGAGRDRNAWRGSMTPSEIHRARSGYYGEISFIDAQVGRLLNALPKLLPADEASRTWLIFTSDHGDMQGDHNLWRKTCAYEGSSRIPLVIVPAAGAGLRRGFAIRQVVELRDIMPTVLAAAGLPAPATVDGKNLLPLLGDRPVRWRRYIHGEHCACYSPEQEMQFVTDGRRKYIWFPRTNAEQFFDLERDPGECRDLSGDPRRQAEMNRWRARLVRELDARRCGWVRDGRPFCPGPEPLVSPFRDRRRDPGRAKRQKAPGKSGRTAGEGRLAGPTTITDNKDKEKPS